MDNSEIYSCRQSAGRYAVSIRNRQEIVSALATFCKDKNIRSGEISGIGAVDKAVLRFFNPQTKQYVDRTFTGQMEIAGLAGNISTLDGEIYLHLHITLGCEDYSAKAGHLLSAVLSGAGEFFITDFGTELKRTFDPDLGLNCYDF